MDNNMKKIDLHIDWIEDLISILQWDIETFCIPSYDKDFILQQIDRLTDRIVNEKSISISRDFLFFIYHAVFDAKNYPDDCNIVSPDRAWELCEELSKIYKRT